MIFLTIIHLSEKNSVQLADAKRKENIMLSLTLTFYFTFLINFCGW